MGKGKERLRGSLGPGLRVVESHQRVSTTRLWLVRAGIEGGGEGKPPTSR